MCKSHDFRSFFVNDSKMKSVNEIIRILREDRKNGLKELDMNIFLTQEEIKQQLNEIDQSEDPDVLRILLINEKEE